MSGVTDSLIKLAREVSTANRDFAQEARELAAGLGKNLGPADDDFPSKLADGQAAFRAFQEAQAALRAAQAAGNAAASDEAADRAVKTRDEALEAMQDALALGEQDATANEAANNQIRSILAFLLYDARKFAEAASLGSLLVKDHPNSASSRQAARVALASLQSLAAGGDAEQPDPARQGAGDRVPGDNLGAAARHIGSLPRHVPDPQLHPERDQDGDEQHLEVPDHHPTELP
jgi:hypothetical protein